MSAVVALLFVLQSISIGFATGAMAKDGAALLGVVCSTSAVQPATSDSSPVKQQHIGPCCILHCGSVIEADGERAPVIVLPFELPAFPPMSDYRMDVAIAAPELRPLSPRAPPAQLV